MAQQLKSPGILLRFLNKLNLLAGTLDVFMCWFFSQKYLEIDCVEIFSPVFFFLLKSTPGPLFWSLKIFLILQIITYQNPITTNTNN
jgi:hypothetical protein